MFNLIKKIEHDTDIYIHNDKRAIFRIFKNFFLMESGYFFQYLCHLGTAPEGTAVEKIGGHRVREAPAGAYSTAPHMTSEVMLSAFSRGTVLMLSVCTVFIRIYPRLSVLACTAFIRIYPHVGHRVCDIMHHVCDVSHRACTMCNRYQLTPGLTTLPCCLSTTPQVFTSEPYCCGLPPSSG